MRKAFLTFRLQSNSPMGSSSTYMFSFFTFRSLIHLEFILIWVHTIRIQLLTKGYFRYYLLKHLSFSLWFNMPFYHMLNFHMYFSSFLGFLVCFIALSVPLPPSVLQISNYRCYKYILISGGLFSFFSFLKVFLDIPMCSFFYMNFRINLHSSREKLSQNKWILSGIFIGFPC